MDVDHQKNGEYNMAKYLCPKLKLCRREGVDLFLKSGIRSIETKCKLSTPPSSTFSYKKRYRLSDYGIRLREKQKIKRIYGILENQFHNYYKKSVKLIGNTGEHLLRFLELRLDNIVYRLGWASTRAEARQLINHKYINVNNITVNIPSYQVSINQLIKLKDKSQNKLRIKYAIELSKQRSICSWLEADVNKMEGRLIRMPDRNDFSSDINEHLIVELYSR